MGSLVCFDRNNKNAPCIMHGAFFSGFAYCLSFNLFQVRMLLVPSYSIRWV
jgi:hypothetical protein